MKETDQDKQNNFKLTLEETRINQATENHFKHLRVYRIIEKNSTDLDNKISELSQITEQKEKISMRHIFMRSIQEISQECYF